MPVLSAGNWGGPGMHLRGNIEGFLRAASKEKWLSLHIGLHWESFYLPRYVEMQKRFFAHYLKGEENSWEKSAPVQLSIRRVDSTAQERDEYEFPLARTVYTNFYLNVADRTLGETRVADEERVHYSALGEGVSFTKTPFQEETEITGFVAARLFVASSTADMDIVLPASKSVASKVSAAGRFTV